MRDEVGEDERERCATSAHSSSPASPSAALGDGHCEGHAAGARWRGGVHQRAGTAVRRIKPSRPKRTQSGTAGRRGKVQDVGRDEGVDARTVGRWIWENPEVAEQVRADIPKLTETWVEVALALSVERRAIVEAAARRRAGERLTVMSGMSKLDARHKRRFVNQFCRMVQRLAGEPSYGLPWSEGRAKFTDEQVVEMNGRQHWHVQFEHSADVYVAEAMLAMSSMYPGDSALAQLLAPRNNAFATWMTLNGQRGPLAIAQTDAGKRLSVPDVYAETLGSSSGEGKWKVGESSVVDENEFMFD